MVFSRRLAAWLIILGLSLLLFYVLRQPAQKSTSPFEITLANHLSNAQDVTVEIPRGFSVSMNQQQVDEHTLIRSFNFQSKTNSRTKTVNLTFVTLSSDECKIICPSDEDVILSPPPDSDYTLQRKTNGLTIELLLKRIEVPNTAKAAGK